MFSGLAQMRKRLYIAVAATALCVLAVIYVVRRQAHTVVYHGQGLQAWALQLSSAQPVARDAATAAFKTMGPKAVPGLIELLETKDPGLRRRVWALAIRLPRKLRAAFFRDFKWPDPIEVRAAAAKALGVIGTDAHDAIPTLARALRDPARQVSLESATALARIGRNSVPALTDALREKDGGVRHVAVYALGEIGPDAQAAVPLLVGMLDETNEPLRASVAYTLSRIGSGHFTELINVIEHGTDPAHEQAAKVLLDCYRSLRPAVPALAKLAQDKSPAVRQQALETLSALREAQVMALGVAIRSLKDPSVEVRLAAINALANVQSPAQALVHPLAECLKDDSAPVRAAAARTLAALGPIASSAAPALKALLEDKDDAVRTAAQEALRVIQCPQPAAGVTPP